MCSCSNSSRDCSRKSQPVGGATSPLRGEPSLDADVATQVENFVGNYQEFFEEDDFVALGIIPSEPTEAKPGSGDKVMMLAARYASGLPLWHDSDCYDHSPDGIAESE